MGLYKCVKQWHDLQYYSFCVDFLLPFNTILKCETCKECIILVLYPPVVQPQNPALGQSSTATFEVSTIVVVEF